MKRMCITRLQVAAIVTFMVLALIPWATTVEAARPSSQAPSGEPGIEIGPDPDAPPPKPRPPQERTPETPATPSTPVPPLDETKEALERTQADVERMREEVEAERRRAEEVLRAEDALREVEEQLKRERIIKHRTDGEEEWDTHGGQVVRMGQDVVVEPGESVDEAVVIGGDLIVKGYVAGDAVSVGGDVLVKPGGHVTGDAVSIGGDLEVEPGGLVDGDEVQVGNIGPIFIPGFGRQHNGPGGWMQAIKSLLTLLVLLFIGWLAMVLIGGRLSTLADVVQNDFWRSLLVGVLVLVLWLPAVFLTTITVIGIPVAIVLVIGVPLAMFFGYLVGALAFGRRLVAGLRFDQGSELMHLLAGLAAIGLLGLLGKLLGIFDILGPVALAFRIVSWALLSFAAILGLGALTMTWISLLQTRRGARAETPPAAGGAPPPPPPPGPEPPPSGGPPQRGKLVWEPKPAGDPLPESPGGSESTRAMTGPEAPPLPGPA